MAGRWGDSKTHNKPLPHGGDRSHTPNIACAESGNATVAVRGGGGGQVKGL